MKIKTLSELSIGGKGNYGIAASAVPYSNDLYTYLLVQVEVQEEIIFMMEQMENLSMLVF